MIHERMRRPRWFPFIPFSFPIALVLAMTGMITFFSYQSRRELEALRREKESD